MILTVIAVGLTSCACMSFHGTSVSFTLQKWDGGGGGLAGQHVTKEWAAGPAAKKGTQVLRSAIARVHSEHKL